MPSRAASSPLTRPYDPFTHIYDSLIDSAEREKVRRATLTAEARDHQL
jgi:hypothetical protein